MWIELRCSLIASRNERLESSFFICAHSPASPPRLSIIADSECPRPAAVAVDHLIDLGHDAAGFGEGDNHAAVVEDVVIGQDAAIGLLLAALGGAVLEPFFAGLIAADVELPGGLGHVLEPAGGV